MTGRDPAVSVVVRSRDEADRLRLTLVSLACQSMRPEVVVVDDGSVDQTPEVLADPPAGLHLTVVRHPRPRGRSAASNAGAAVASGPVLIFLDGDTLAGPDMVARHAAAHSRRPGSIARGETWHLRCTRLLLDPERGCPRDEHAAEVAALAPSEREALTVTRVQIVDDFAAIERRAQPGIYPGYGPRRLHDLELDALRRFPDCTVLWAAASGSNLSMDREAFREAGGFHERLDLNEHRELALRLCERGGRMVPADGARTFHMIHRSGWRDPLLDLRWHETFLAAHPTPAVRLLPMFWQGLVDRKPEIASLPDLEAEAARAHAVAASDGPR